MERGPGCPVGRVPRAFFCLEPIQTSLGFREARDFLRAQKNKGLAQNLGQPLLTAIVGESAWEVARTPFYYCLVCPASPS
jgi:hypothetical protein